MISPMNYTIGVLGSGVMGSQIAILCADSGFNVLVWDIKTKEEMENIFNDCAAESRQRISIANSIADLRTCDYIEECLPENYKIKTEVYEILCGCVSPKTVLATNTSSLSVTDLSRKAPYPENFVLVHFFNPVKTIKLIEVVFLPKASEYVKNVVENILTALKREPIYTSDSSGFIVNRLLMPMINEAANLLDSGINTALEIDNAMRWGARHPLGPLALADLIGLDTCLSIMNNLNAKLGKDYYKISSILKEHVVNGRLGRKTKKGFYDYK